MSDRYDAVVIGAGPAGRGAAGQLADAGMRVAACERELVGGECPYWACIPSKVLLRPPEARADARRAAGLGEPEQRFAEVAAHRDELIRHLDDSAPAQALEKKGIDLFRGEARIAGPGRVEVADRTLETERILVACGTVSTIPPVDGLEQAGYWTNREATTLSEIPESVVVLGAGPVGIELSQMLHRFGAQVTLLQASERLLPREDHRVGELIGEALRQDGIDVRTGARAAAVTRGEDGRRTVSLAGGGEVSGAVVLVAIGRRPRTDGLGLEEAGIELGEGGEVEVDEHCRAGEGVWAIGDVNGTLPFTHVASYQARVACADILGREAQADYAAIPRVVFCDPEIAAVGLSAADARDQGIDVVTSRLDLVDSIARPITYEREPRGQELEIVADRARGVLVGAWAVAPLAGEWIHQVAMAIKLRAPLEMLRDTVSQFPTYAEGFTEAVRALEA
ncbi:MAG: PF00070 family, FAD-dependent NAD(P)-disulphide oxidoreductase [uncultured Solirubrobacterales bacterium]|uniref:PF00070 family, FAD-dependent NAD(P)-disulphide oxidoreductase n=1 Tax=uncultured Solirubrobacterales bacterium TaxID=768556 RepID=A0A6J4T612_9ACTN|nr:MAG: PF00070 family, FAD-dependent NAD(P)-disulphide oxidoreductase [uncultured Solirubrobacterales bacterium]